MADLEHLGGMDAGASSAAEFLARFARDVPWRHIDIFGARLLVDIVERFD